MSRLIWFYHGDPTDGGLASLFSTLPFMYVGAQAPIKCRPSVCLSSQSPDTAASRQFNLKYIKLNIQRWRPHAAFCASSHPTEILFLGISHCMPAMFVCGFEEGYWRVARILPIRPAYKPFVRTNYQATPKQTSPPKEDKTGLSQVAHLNLLQLEGRGGWWLVAG